MAKLRLFKAKADGFDRARLARFRKQGVLWNRELTKTLGKEYLRVMRMRTPRDTGAARRSIRLQRRGKGFELFSDLKYFNVLENGHRKLVKKNGFFVFDVDGKTVFTRVIKARKGLFIVKRTIETVNSGTLANLNKRVVKKVFK